VKRVQHMVVVKFRPGVPEATIAGLFAELGELRQVIPGIEHFAWGPYSSPEGLNGGFTHGFLMTFRDAAARDGYLPHPEHERVKQLVLPHVEGVVAFDFEE
jgi:Stress responsive A/B Barrel Domain